MIEGNHEAKAMMVAHVDKGIKRTCRHATEGIGPIRYYVGDRRLDDPASEAEIGQMRSVIGSLGWIARQCRPDLSYAVSKGQGAVTKATVKDLKETNLALGQAKDYSGTGILFDSKALS